MGSGFLRDAALRRQLEAKVKEATRTRREAQEAIDAAKALVDGGKAVDARMTEAEKALAEATQAIGDKDYKAALERANEAREKATRAYGERAQEIFTTTQNLMKTAAASGVSDPDATKLMTKAEEALGKSSFPEAVDFTQRAWKRSEKGLMEHLNSSFSRAQALILSAKKMGEDTGATEDLLSRARSAAEANDYEMALGFTKECLETVGGDLKDQVDKQLADTQAAVQTAKEFGGDVSNVERLLERANEDVAKGDYDKAFNTIKQARGEADKSLEKSLESSSTRFVEILAAAEAIGADVAKARDLLQKSERATRDGDVRKATDFAREGMEALRTAQFDRVVGIISRSRDKFVMAKNVGADITEPLDLLNRAREQMQASEFEEALRLAKDADEAIDKIVGEYRNLEGEIRTMLRTFGDAEVLGVDTSPAKRLLERARSALGSRDFKGAVDLLRRSREELDRSQSERVMETIQRAEYMLASGERMGADLSEPAKALEEAVTASKGRNFTKAMQLATRSRELSELAIQQSLADSVSGLTSSMQYLGDAASTVQTLVDRAQSALSARDFETASGYLEEAMRLAQGRTKDRALEFHDLLRAAIQLGIDLGSDVGPLEDGLKTANADIDRGRYAEVIGLKDRLMREIAVVADNVFNLVKGKVVEARSLRIDITEMRELLKRAKMALGVEDYMESFTFLTACNDQANKTVGLHKEVYNAISSAAALVAEAKKRDVNVASVLELLLDSKRAHEQFDYERALELANRAKAETEKLMILYTSAQKIIQTRELVEIAAKEGVEVDDIRAKLEEAKSAMKSRDYEAALEHSESSDKVVRERIGERVTSVLSASESLIDGLQGIDVLPQEEKLIRAREALDSGNVQGALEMAAGLRVEVEAIKRDSEQSSVAVSRLQDLISELEAMSLDASEGANFLIDAKDAHQQGRFDVAIALASEATEKLESLRKEGIEERIARFEKSIQEAKRKKVNTRSAEKMLAKAREFLAEGKYRQAIALATQSEGEAERVGLQQEMAQRTIATTEEKVASFWVEIPPLKTSIEKAKAAFEAGDYVKALDHAIKTGEQFNSMREVYEEALEVGKRAQRLREVASAIDQDTEGVDGLLDKAQGALEEGAPDRARDHYQQALDDALKAVQDTLANRLETATALAKRAQRLGKDADVAFKKVSEARALLEAEDYEGTLLSLNEASAVAQVAIQGAVEEQLGAAQANVEHSRKLGADVTQAEDQLAKARATVEAGETEKGLEMARGIERLAPAEKADEKPFAEKSFEAEAMIRSARKFGIDVAEAERRLGTAIRMKQEDPDRAFMMAEEALESAQKAVAAFSPKIVTALKAESPTAGDWAVAKLTVTNESKALAKNVRIEILGDAEVEGLKDIPAIKAKGSEEIALRVKMNSEGSIPLVVKVVSERVFDGKAFPEESVATIAVGPRVTAAAALSRDLKEAQAAAETKCPVCRGVIKVGFKVSPCPNCGTEMHDLCASRAGRCPECGTNLGGDPAKRKKISFKMG